MARENVIQHILGLVVHQGVDGLTLQRLARHDRKGLQPSLYFVERGPQLGLCKEMCLLVAVCCSVLQRVAVCCSVL